MRYFGKVVKYDGNIGSIIDENGNEVLLLVHECKDKIVKGDYVSFEIDEYNDIEYNTLLARFVKKVDINL